MKKPSCPSPGFLRCSLRAAVLLLGACGPCALAQSNYVSEPLGFISLTIRGTTNSETSALSFLGLGMVRGTYHVGTLDGFASGTLIETNSSWTANQFAGTNGSYCVEITSGANAGVFSDIVSNGPTNLVTVDDLASFLSGGESFRVHRNWTLGSLFGATNSAGLGGGTASTADEVVLYQPGNGTFSNFYYKTTGLGGTGWRHSANATLSAADVSIGIDQSVLVRRKLPGNLTVRLPGTVKLGPTAIAVEPNLAIIGNVYPVASLTLGNSGLYTTNDSTGLAGGSTTTADLLLVYSNNEYYSYFYKTNSPVLGGTGWRLSGNASSNMQNMVIAPGTGILIQRRGGRPAFNWRVPQPFTLGN